VTYWLAATTPLGVMTRYLKTCMPALGLSWELLLVSLVSIAVGVLGGCLMISEWGVIGMPLAVFLAEIVCLVMQIYYLAKKSPEMKLLELLKSWLATCSGLAACYFSAALLGFGDPQRAVLAVLVFAVGLAVRIRQNWLPKARVLMQQAKVAS
jgi:Na+-driven multidrug efflux pump